MSVPKGMPPTAGTGPLGGGPEAGGEDLDSCATCRFYVPAGSADGGECTAMGDPSVKPDTFVTFNGKRPKIAVFADGYCSDFEAGDGGAPPL